MWDGYIALEVDAASREEAEECRHLDVPSATRQSRHGRFRYSCFGDGGPMKIGVVTFPGSNCDYDCYKASQEVLGAETVFLWHASHDLQGVDAVFLPGGFSYGDYLRAGSIASLSPIMREVRDFAAAGGPVAGICNGFQILCETGLLPGALIRNRSLRFISRPTYLRVELSAPPFTSAYQVGQVLRVPIAHGEGCYLADEATLDRSRATASWSSATATRAAPSRQTPTPTDPHATSPESSTRRAMCSA
jgi:phosphoribosylformylglycinamidine synthase I